MPLETATYIAGLVPSNPAASDGMNNADDHMRLTKSAVQNSFPNIAGAVTASHTQFNSLLSQLLGTTAYTAPLGAVATPSYAFIGDLDTGWYSPGANRAALSLGGADALNFAADKTAAFAAGATFAGPVAATGPITGPGSVPIGGMLMWLTDTLPTGAGVWCWANGGTLSRTAAGAGLELFNAWGGAGGGGTRYGVGDGSTTFNVINMQEVAPVGKSGMGGAASPGLLASIASGLKAALGGLFGADTHALTTPQLAAHTHSNSLTDPGHFHTENGGIGTGFGTVNITAGSTIVTGQNLSPTTAIATTGITITNASAGSGVAHNNVQPSSAVNFIIRIA